MGALLVLALLLAGCRLDLIADVEVGTDGGVARLTLALDGGLVAELDALAVDPTAELEAAAADVDGWQVQRSRRDDGSLDVTLERSVADASELGPAFRELTAGLADEDPALELDLDVRPGPDGEVSVDGQARLRPPATSGAAIDGDPVGPTGQDLVALMEDHVTAHVAVTLPGEVVEHTGGELAGRTITWEVDAGDTARIEAAAAPAPWWRQLPSWALPAAAAVIVVSLLAVWWSRRRAGDGDGRSPG